jgi:hypothetical protein
MNSNRNPNFLNSHSKESTFLMLGVIFLSFLNLVSCKSIEVPTDRKIMSNRQFKETVYVTDKTPKPKGKRYYYWYKSQKVHFSQNNYGGELLDGEYIKHYNSNQLAEKGNFKKGLKSGRWTMWYKNGMVARVSNWKKGRRSGRYISRDSLGQIVTYGSFQKGKKDGKWISAIEEDTLYFVKGEEIILDTTVTDSLVKKSFLKQIFSSKEGRAEERIRRNKTKKENGSFFKRIFKKKSKKAKTGEEKPVQSSMKSSDEPLKKQKFKKKADSSKNNKKTKVVQDKEKKKAEDNTNKEGFFKRLFGKKEKSEPKK